MTDTTRFYIGLLAALLGVVAYLPYFWGIYRGRTRPHAISWLIWSILSGIAFTAQLLSNAGPGAWALGVTTFSCFLIFLASLYRGEHAVSRFDWGCLILAMLTIIPWAVSGSPTVSIFLIVAIDFVGFLPTYRKSYWKPDEEALLTYALSTLKLLISLFALTEHTLATTFYPASIAATNTIFVLMTLWRRKVLARAITASAGFSDRK